MKNSSNGSIWAHASLGAGRRCLVRGRGQGRGVQQNLGRRALGAAGISGEHGVSPEASQRRCMGTLVCTSVHVCMRASVWACVHVCSRVCMHVSGLVCTCAHVSVCMCLGLCARALTPVLMRLSVPRYAVCACMCASVCADLCTRVPMYLHVYTCACV